MSDQITNAPNPPPPEPTCPECGAKIRGPRATRCWMCQEPFTAMVRRDDGPNPFRLPEPKADSPAWAVFGALAILICGGLMFDAPGILVVLCILLVPALVRTLVATTRTRAPLSVGSTLLAFFSSIGIVTVVGIAATAAFLATCFAACLGGVVMSGPGLRGINGILIFGCVLGGLIALVVFVLLMRALWPKKV